MRPTRTTTVAATLAGLGIAVATAAPAAANDATLRIRNGSGTVVAKAWYNDLTDTLCVRSYVKGVMATARIGPSGGGTFATANDAGFKKSTNCTGNLSIPEDRLYWMNLSFRTTSKDTTFYT
ncbi:MAG: hypothetical protein IE926_09715 [Micrococcales bacterium]|nr:hypothetical protein [Micrococcales bacterium]